jgi:hypothetical protein
MHGRETISLRHLDRMTDSTGLVQHAIYGIPRRESGYTTDDNARALRLCVRLWSRRPDERMLRRVTTYLSFLEYARTAGGGFHNFLGYDRRWLDTEGCGDCQGQAVRALADVLASDLPAGHRAVARELIDMALPTLADLQDLRAQAYVVIACGRLQSAKASGIEALAVVALAAAERLLECYRAVDRSDWHWFEPRMTYANAILPHALFVAAENWAGEDFLEAARVSFAFLDRQTTANRSGGFLLNGADGSPVGTAAVLSFGHDGFFWPIGNDGWWPCGREKALYDQQPVEAVTMADAALAAFRLLGDEECLAVFRRAHAWFHGRNSLERPLADASCGACFDGLTESGVNQNQGAESTLAYLWTELRHREVMVSLADSRRTKAAMAGR